MTVHLKDNQKVEVMVITQNREAKIINKTELEVIIE